MLPIPRAARPPAIKTMDISNFLGGTVTALDDGRTPADGLRDSGNVYLEQDGVVRPRPSLVRFGPQATGTIIGEIFPFRYINEGIYENWLISMQTLPQNEVQTLTMSGAPTGGTFTISYSGKTTSAIAYNATASTIQTALAALSNIGTGNVTCTGGALPAAVVITFSGTLENTPVTLTTADSLTGGTSPKSVMTETSKGGNTGRIHIATPEDTTWTEISTVAYNPTASARFFQLNDKVLILNGQDTLSYLDITTCNTTPAITTYNPINDPAAPSLKTNTGLTGTSYNVWYAVTANSSVGETTGTYFEQQVSTDRSLWNKDTQNITIQWTTVPGVQSWNVYAAVTADGDNNPTLGLLASGLAANTLNFTDDGTMGIATYKEMPKDNSTAGPKGARGVAINGRAWITGDKNNPYYVWHGGDPGHELDFTPANGGGYVNIGNGTLEVPAVVWNFREGTGAPEIKCLSRGLNGQGKRYAINSTTLTYGSSSFTVWVPTEDYGYSGTDSPDGLIQYNNSTYYPSRDGFKVLGTKPQMQNLLSNDEVSQTIKPDMKSLNNDAMLGCVGIGFEERLYWAVPVGSSSNNQIWVLDLERGGAWMKPWNIDADWMTLIQDSSGNTHQCILSNNVLYELSRLFYTTDDGKPFSTSGTTGIVYFSKDGREWGRLIRVVVEVLRPQGVINFSVSGFTKSKVFIPLSTQSLVQKVITNGYGWDAGAWDRAPYIGWDNYGSAPAITSRASLDVNMQVQKDIRYFVVSWESTESGVDYALSKIIAEYVDIGIRNLN